jgi:hypothetical protein
LWLPLYKGEVDICHTCTKPSHSSSCHAVIDVDADNSMVEGLASTWKSKVESYMICVLPVLLEVGEKPGEALPQIGQLG